MTSPWVRSVKWVTVVAGAELLSFVLIRNSMDVGRSDGSSVALVVGAMLLMGVVVTLAFREALRGENIAVANCWWIVLSMAGGVLVDRLVYGVPVENRMILATALVFAGAAAASWPEIQAVLHGQTLDAPHAG